MNRDARRHLMTLLERASTPLFVMTFPERRAKLSEEDDFASAIRALGEQTSLVLPPAVSIEIIKPRNLPRVVAGKGARQRGVRGRAGWGAPRPVWKALAVPYLFKRWAALDPAA